MKLSVQNRILTKENETTWLTQACTVGATALTVKDLNANVWAQNDWVILGEIGAPNAEVVQVNAATSTGTAVTVTATKYAHSVDEPFYRVSYNRIKYYWAQNEADVTKTFLASVLLQPENIFTHYEDTTHTSGYGFAQFFNSFNGTVSPFSDGIPYQGQSPKALASMMQKIRTLMDEESDEFISDGQIKDGINDKQRDIINERLWTFDEDEFSTSSVAYQFEYPIPEQIKTTHTVRFLTEPLIRLNEGQYELLNWNTSQSNTYPAYVAIWAGSIRVWAPPANSAATTTLSADIDDSQTTIGMASTSEFRKGDFFRFIIDDEVIYSTNNTTTDFTGCVRGCEGTTPAAHLSGATVTERDIVFLGQANAVDLEALDDETIIPEPLAICYGVAADFCAGKLNKPTLADRYNARYETSIESLRNKYTLKMTSQFKRVKDARQVISDQGINNNNPNNFPMNVIAPPLT